MIKITFTDSSTLVVERVVFHTYLSRAMIGWIYKDEKKPTFQDLTDVEKIEAA